MEKWPKTELGTIHKFPQCSHVLFQPWTSGLFSTPSSECEKTVRVIISLLLSPLCRIECFACEILMVGTYTILSCSPAFFFFFGWLKPCRGKKSVSVWVTSRRWELDVWSEVTGNGCLFSPISTQGIATWVLNSNVLTHYSLERRTSENAGVRSAELVVSFAVYSCRNKLLHSTPGVAKFCLPKRLPGVVCVLETSGVNSYLGGIYRWWHHSFPVFPLPH